MSNRVDDHTIPSLGFANEIRHPSRNGFCSFMTCEPMPGFIAAIWWTVDGKLAVDVKPAKAAADLWRYMADSSPLWCAVENLIAALCKIYELIEHYHVTSGGKNGAEDVHH